MKHFINAMLRIGRIKLVDDSGSIQRLQVDEGSLGAFGGRRIIDKVPHIQQFGFASSPPIDSEVMLAAPAGDRTQTIALGTNHQPSRPTILKAGDAIQYDVRGAKVWLSEDGIIIDGAGLPIVVHNCPTVTVTATEKITLDAPETGVTGSLHVAGAILGATDITAQSEIMAAGGAAKLNVLRAAYAVHKHAGVASGSGTSAGPDTPA